MMYWYYMRSDLRNGPVSDVELKKLVTNGIIGPDTMVWNKDIKDWTKAHNIPDLIPVDFCPPPPPEQPPALHRDKSASIDTNGSNQLPPVREMEQRNYTSPADSTNKITTPYVGLGGWLVLPAIGIVIAPIIIAVVSLWPAIKLLLNGSWALLTTPGSTHYTPYFGPIAISEMVIHIGLIIAWMFIGFLFFTKKRLFPRWYVGMMMFSSVFVIVDAWLVTSIIPSQSMSDHIGDISGQLITTIIWSWYMLVSRRVKATFVNEI